ncbi:PssD/Cps14F family polysaccharide biosynthesis glycosyltransferase [Enterococcus sp. CSURQ0835]|uniref:PssD/Cps14F family polysaccharide biosynthesis glycosyltransferase n=1 Tax=Enterococcus sp. CSURQ0835 TaxID=2681394 RepID=UPI001F15C51B|nr:PssD/Cps14F family polysaccharide biosynthesis glycosyltransferase [Enterococcus sp. CSURQ0835]
MRKKKICLIASSGGHYEQLLMLKNLDKDHELFMVTEKTIYSRGKNKLYYIRQINRREKLLFIYLLENLIQSLFIFLKEKPDVIISTGALSVIPMFIIGKIFRRKLIFIESFAKSDSCTLTGKFIYKFADEFIVQWESMIEVYPKAKFYGSIY